MQKRTVRFQEIAAEITEVNVLREQVVLKAFQALERQDAPLARILLQNIGDRQRAARWMCMHQRAFDGRSAYEVLAEGDVDSVWDRVLGTVGGDAQAEARMAL